MTLFNKYFSFALLFFFYTKYLLAYPCYGCNSMHFNYPITIDNLPSPTRNDCQIVTAETGCFVHVGWYNDHTSEVFYGTNFRSSRESVTVVTESRVNVSSGLYITHKYIIFTCASSNTTPCNTVENLKKSIISTTFPADEEIKRIDELIIPTTEFNSSLCFEFSNMTDFCPKTDLLNCQQCLIAVEVSPQETIVCAACPEDEIIWNLFKYFTEFLLNTRTRLDDISLTCQTGNACNSMENMEILKQTTMSKFDFDKYFYSTASNTKLTLILLLLTFFIGLFRLF